MKIASKQDFGCTGTKRRGAFSACRSIVEDSSCRFAATERRKRPYCHCVASMEGQSCLLASVPAF